MTKAKVRVCHRCKAQFMKLDGCNKMTCRCGAKMCYICRQPNVSFHLLTIELIMSVEKFLSHDIDHLFLT